MGDTRRRRVTWLGIHWSRVDVRHSAERRGTASPAGDPIVLTDPSPEPLTHVTAPWGLVLEAAPTTPARALSPMARRRYVGAGGGGDLWGQDGAKPAG
ncbi:MAG: hypothetical protein QOG14_3299 [Mycobacterium sp.]|jgi:hypothetical protein|nr:hypothetical protein [Mycobacterium sp.]